MFSGLMQVQAQGSQGSVLIAHAHDMTPRYGGEAPGCRPAPMTRAGLARLRPEKMPPEASTAPPMAFGGARARAAIYLWKKPEQIVDLLSYHITQSNLLTRIWRLVVLEPARSEGTAGMRIARALLKCMGHLLKLLS